MFVALVGGRTAATRPAEIMITTCDGDEDEDEPLSPSAVGDDPGMKVLLEVKSPDITPGEYGRVQIQQKDKSWTFSFMDKRFTTFQEIPKIVTMFHHFSFRLYHSKTLCV